jgi:hypothetical protein
MNRIDSPWGRLYATPMGLAPSVTTVLKATDPKPFSQTRWRDSVVRKGITDADADLYAPVFARRHGIEQLAVAHRILEDWIQQPLPYPLPEAQAHADAFTAWKSEHSGRRGDALHAHLEGLLPVGRPLTWEAPPRADDRATNALLESLWSGGVLSDITEVLSVEQRLWYWRNGIGYAGSEDICYVSARHGLLSGDWKTKDPKPYCPSKYGDDYKLQLVAYAGARAARLGTQVDGLAVNYCFTDGSPAVQSVVTQAELASLWLQWQARLRAWWATIGPQLARWNDQRPAADLPIPPAQCVPQ